VTNLQKGGLVVAAVLVLIMGYVIVKPEGDPDVTTVSTTAPLEAQPAPAPATSTETAPAETTPAETTPAPPARITIVVKGGKPVGGIQDIKVKKGDTVDFVVRSDQGGEIHLHGYDVKKEIPDGGGRVEFKLEAANDGIYEIEVEATGTQIGTLTVEP
jgi:plastocyanin